MNIPEVLATIPIFNGLPQEQYNDLAVIIADKTFERGQIIFSEGDPGTGFYVVVDGRVKIYKLSMDGKEQILHLWGAGEPFGEVALFTGQDFPAYAEAMEKTRAFYVPRQAFADLIKENPSLALNMLATLSMRLHKFANLIEDLSLKEVSGRLAAHFIELSRRQGDANSITLDLAKGQLASLLGTIPETLSRTLTRMVRQGLIQTDGPNIEIINHDDLKELAVSARRLSEFVKD
jgi:CRP-like cAMP-binding protein